MRAVGRQSGRASIGFCPQFARGNTRGWSNLRGLAYGVFVVYRSTKLQVVCSTQPQKFRFLLPFLGGQAGVRAELELKLWGGAWNWLRPSPSRFTDTGYLWSPPKTCGPLVIISGSFPMFSLVLAAVGGLWAPAEGELGLGNWTNHSTVLFVDGNRDSHNKSNVPAPVPPCTAST